MVNSYFRYPSSTRVLDKILDRVQSTRAVKSSNRTALVTSKQFNILCRCYKQKFVVVVEKFGTMKQTDESSK